MKEDNAHVMYAYDTGLINRSVDFDPENDFVFFLFDYHDYVGGK